MANLLQRITYLESECEICKTKITVLEDNYKSIKTIMPLVIKSVNDKKNLEIINKVIDPDIETTKPVVTNLVGNDWQIVDNTATVSTCSTSTSIQVTNNLLNAKVTQVLGTESGSLYECSIECILGTSDKMGYVIKNGTTILFDSGDITPATWTVVNGRFKAPSSSITIYLENRGTITNTTCCFDKTTLIKIPISLVDYNDSSSSGYTGDGDTACKALLNNPKDIIGDSNYYYIADTNNHVIRKIEKSTNTISTIAGTGIAGFSGDDGQAILAQLNSPNELFLEGTDLLIVDSGNNTIRKIDLVTNIITSITGKCPVIEIEGPSLSNPCNYGRNVQIIFQVAGHLQFDSCGNIYVHGTGYGDGYITVFTKECNFYNLITVANSKFFAINKNKMYFLVPTNGALELKEYNLKDRTFIPNSWFTGAVDFLSVVDNVTLATELTSTNSSIDTCCFDFTRNCIYIAFKRIILGETLGFIIRISLVDSTVRKVFGNSSAQDFGDNGQAVDAKSKAIRGMVVDSYGNIYFTTYYNQDYQYYLIRKINISTGIVTRYAGKINVGNELSSGDNGSSLDAVFSAYAIAIDNLNNIYIYDASRIWNNGTVRTGGVIRKISYSSGIITRYAGTYHTYGMPSFSGYQGEGVLATNSLIYGTIFNYHNGMIFDSYNNMYFMDLSNDLFNRYGIRRIDATTGIINTLYGDIVSNSMQDYDNDASGICANSIISNTNTTTTPSILSKVTIVNQQNSIVSSNYATTILVELVSSDTPIQSLDTFSLYYTASFSTSPLKIQKIAYNSELKWYFTNTDNSLKITALEFSTINLTKSIQNYTFKVTKNSTNSYEFVMTLAGVVGTIYSNQSGSSSGATVKKSWKEITGSDYV